MDCIHHSLPKLYNKLVKLMSEGAEPHEICSEAISRMCRWLRVGGGIHGLYGVVHAVNACDNTVSGRERLLEALQANQAKNENSRQSQILTRAAMGMLSNPGANRTARELAREYLRKSIEHGVVDTPAFVAKLGMSLSEAREMKARFMRLMENGICKLGDQLAVRPDGKGVRKPPERRKDKPETTSHMLAWKV